MRADNLSAASVLAVLLGTCAIACSALFGDAAQCKVDRDCDRFVGAVCDLPSQLCVVRPPSSSTEPAADDLGDAAALDTSAVDPRCDLPNKPSAVVPVTTVNAPDGGTEGHITGALTLDCSKEWSLRGRVFVDAGGTLTIKPGTTIHAEKASNAGLVILPGARLIASGNRDAPVIFTSDQAAPLPGDWRGLVVLGKGPAAAPGATFLGDPEMPFGGANADDDSGVLSYVRVEYGGIGLGLAGVGRTTKIDSVEVRESADDCFRFDGGAVDAKHLVCQFTGDEYFQFQGGYSGRVQYLFGQKKPAATADSNGILTDAAFPVIYNATLCGDSQTDRNYGLVVRNGSKLDMNNAILTNWFAAVDTRNLVVSPLELRSSIAFGNAANPAVVEDPVVVDATLPTFNDDQGFDEIAWFRTAARTNAETSPGLAACSDPKAPKPYPAVSLIVGARTPPQDGFFDAAAVYIGAFRDANDDWMGGAWVRFDDH